jgi:butyrate kinase
MNSKDKGDPTKQHHILVINPGSTSTKLGLINSEGKILYERGLEHKSEAERSIRELVSIRTEQIRTLLAEIADFEIPSAVVGRGGPLRPLDGGTYLVNEKMIEELLSEKWSAHPSNLGAPIAREFAVTWAVPAYVVDPVSVDNFTDVARISGVHEITRRCRSHALNIRSCAHLAAQRLGKPISQTRFVIAHLGGGISIAAVDGGRIIDVNDGLLGMGPFSPERAGALPLEGLIDLALSGKFSKEELKSYLSKRSGLQGYLGTNNLREVEQRIESGDEKADLVFRAMVYQIAKEIGGCAAVLAGKLDAIVVTGGLSNSQRLIEALRSYAAWMGTIFIYPGERELEAMAAGAFRVLNGSETAKEY